MNRDRLAERIAPPLQLVYPEDAAEAVGRILDLADRWAPAVSARLAQRIATRPSAGTAYLITYGDAIRRDGEAPLHTLAEVLREVVDGVVTDVHLLPIYPWTSDDGFAVVDHREVNPHLGTWDDVSAIAADHGLMLDFVANHVSASSPWFSGWLAGTPERNGYFLDPGPGFDTSRVVRPRTSPLVHDYVRPDGTKARAWTTFSRDQVDINVREPAVLAELTDVLLGYIARGATTVRLDAIGFLWKESGTTSLHLPQTHAVIKVWRALLDELAPGVRLLTETNVPHAENISYFGDGDDEAHMVYQFALPPLVLHAFVTGDATTLGRWASTIGPVGPSATWFNFLASHDGIGMRPSEGLLTETDRALLVERALAHGGRVSMTTRPDGSEGVYELNVSYLDALSAPGSTEEEVAGRALAAHSILLAMIGVPAIYYHSLFGSTHDREGMESSGDNRRINRAVLDADQLVAELSGVPRRHIVFEGLRNLMAVRRAQPAFSPFASQRVEHLDPRVLAIRRAAGTADEVVAVTNVSGEPVDLPGVHGVDLVTGEPVAGLRLGPHEYAWIAASDG